MDRNLIKSFWNCGDSDIIDFAITRARLNANEKRVITLILDHCLSQEQTAEEMDISPRKVQMIWREGVTKLLKIPWVYAYAILNDNDK